MKPLPRLVILFAMALSSPAFAGRVTVDLNNDWKFLRDDTKSFDDSAWPAVTLPHTWNNLDGQDGGNNYHRGPAWYRRHLKFDPAWKGKTVYLRFGAASMAADVYVNGKPVGQHKGAFAAFCFDITPQLKEDDNIIAVRVTNSPDKDIAPLSADFTFFGGLYRGAQLIVTEPVAVSLLDDGSIGVYVRQDSVSSDEAKLTVTTIVRNAGTEAKITKVRCEIAGVAIEGETTVPPGAVVTEEQKLVLPHPHLWDGKHDPYRYPLKVTVGDDSIDQMVGLRSFRVDPNQGFILNGKPYRLYGVNRHQDRLDKGWAVSIEDEQSDIDNILDMGCTALRLAHYQQSPSFYDLCDKNGLIVWAEIPLVNEVNDSPEFDANAKQMLRELIKQNCNHPSICFWGLSNEYRNGEHKNPAGVINDKHQIPLQTELNKLAKELDPTRPTTSATLHGPGAPIDNITDVIAYNNYSGWYGGKPSDWAAYLDKLHAKYPDRPVGVSEYGAGASINQHEAGPVKQPKPGGPWHPEEWQAEVHEQAWAAMKSRPWIFGTYIWNLHDFAVDGRKEGDTPGRNDKGMVTYDGKTKKDAFWFYKANWSDKPVIYIADRRFTPRPAGATVIKVYSNCESVELKVNGKSLGDAKGNDVNVFTWPADLVVGENQVEATGRREGKTFDDRFVVVTGPQATTKP